MELGGNKVTSLNRKIKKTFIATSKYYFYNHYNLKKNERIVLPKNTNFTVFVLNCKNDSFIKMGKKKSELRNIHVYILKSMKNCRR